MPQSKRSSLKETLTTKVTSKKLDTDTRSMVESVDLDEILEDFYSPEKDAPTSEVAVATSSISATFNLGNYQSVRVECGLSLPFKVDLNDKSSLDAAATEAYEYVLKRINQELERVSDVAAKLF